MGCSCSKEKTKAARGDRGIPGANAEKNPILQPKEVEIEVKDSPVLSPWELKKKKLTEQLLMKNSIFKYDMCTVEGEVTPLFEQKGLCYIIVQNDKWFVYNDTINYEFHLNYKFLPHSDIAPGDRATLKIDDNKSIVVSAVVYPLETIELARGQMGEHESEIFAQPLSDVYLKNIQMLTKEAEEEMREVLQLADGSLDDEAVLQKCVEKGIPFVDPSFLPSQNMLSRHRVDGRNIEPKGLRRSKELRGIKVEEIDAAQGDIFPQLMDVGLLGDNWFLCAMAILAEDEERVKNMFSLSKPEEKQLGAYRLFLNKDGWWKSVLLDDFLPTVNNVPCFARVTNNPSELWVSLLQKAYAKLHGSYASITGGDTLHALKDFSGAPTYRFDEAWMTATQDSNAADELLDNLARHTEAGNAVLLTTPAKMPTGSDTETGLRNGYTYYVEAVRRFPEFNLTLLKIHNPWEPVKPWTGSWSAKCSNWDVYERVKNACNPDFTAIDGTFWMEWADAAKYFDGCGVVYTVESPVYDYRVLGEFDYVNPNVVLMVHATEPVEVMLTLTQRDKRGLHVEDIDARFSPLMLSVSSAHGDKQRVEKNSSINPEEPTDVYAFIVAKEVAMTYKFEPSEEPYFVIPRIYHKGTSEGQKKGFVLGVRSSTPLENKLDVQFTQLDAASSVFKNCVLFTVEETPEVIRQFQKKFPEGGVVTDVGGKLSTAVILKKARSVEENEEEGLSNGDEDNKETQEEEKDGNDVIAEDVAEKLKESLVENGNGHIDAVENEVVVKTNGPSA